MRGVHEVLPLTARASLDGKDIFELETGHRQMPFKGSLKFACIRSGTGGDLQSQKARPLLDELKISYQVPERPTLQVSRNSSRHRATYRCGLSGSFQGVGHDPAIRRSANANASDTKPKHPLVVTEPVRDSRAAALDKVFHAARN